jgi:peptide deformylase
MNNPVLKLKCNSVTEFGTKKLKEIIQDLIDTCEVKEDITAGLSAPQIGISLRVCVCRRIDLEEDDIPEPLPLDQLWEVMINPVIIKASEKTSIYWEGCLSVGEGPNGLYGPVERSNSIDIEYFDVSGKKKELKCVGFFAHIIQHEIDHLNGIIFLKYIKDPKNIWLCKDLDGYYDKFGEYPPI